MLEAPCSEYFTVCIAGVGFTIM